MLIQRSNNAQKLAGQTGNTHAPGRPARLETRMDIACLAW